MQQPSNGPTIILQAPSKTTYPIHEKAVFGLSTTILVLGIISVILQLAGSIVGIGLGELGAGIWCGIWFILTGSFGISAARQKTKCKIVTLLVLSIISASIFAVSFLTITSIGLSIDNWDHDYYCDYHHDEWWYDRSCSAIKAGLGLNSVMMILSIVIGILSILASAFSCGAFCCGQSTQGTVMSQTIPSAIPYVQQAGPSQVVVLMPSPTYPGHYTIAHNPNIAGNQRNAVAPQGAPPCYDNLGYGGYGAYGGPTVPASVVEYPAVHQPTTNTAPQNETKASDN